MSPARWLGLGAAALALAAAAPAAAQSPSEEDRFFIDKADPDLDKTLWQGSLTSSSFYYAESSGDATPVPVDNASPFSRMWTDLRAQIDARHIKGGRWDARIDTRARYVADPFGTTDAPRSDRNRIQSGTFGLNEYDLRELYLVRGGRRSDLFIGRQVVADLGAIKIDGIRLDYAKNKRWTYLGFAGLYPARGSRSIQTDYPQGISELPPYQRTGRAVPVTGGFGAAYRTQKTYGALGGVLIVPTSRDGGQAGTDTFEQPRIYLSANGYWRRSAKLDLYHYLIFDVYGSAGQTLTNGSVGLQWKPTPRLRVHLSANQIDTEALHVQVRAQLENEPPLDGVVINNVEVQRIASTSARAAITAAFGKLHRFEFSAALAGRRRPEVILEAGVTDFILPAAQGVELQLQAVDRKFFGWRLDGSLVRSIGVGQAGYARSRALIVRVAGTRELKDGKAQIGADLSYVGTADDNAGQTCQAGGDPTDCYGAANTTVLQASGLGYYRLKDNWFVNGALGVGTQRITTTGDGGVGVPQDGILYGHAYLRLGYRF